MLGLSGPARMGDFHALCDNRHPATGMQLTRSNRENRRPLYDFTFSVPKSVAVMRGLFRDDRIQQAILDSVDDMMELVEQQMQARVRADGKSEDRTVGNAAWLPFYHTLSRPVDGVADPGDHVHACLLSLVYDPEEDQWKSAQVGGIKSSAPFYQAAWHANLARRLQALGFETRKTRDAFEIVGIDDRVIQEFSRRKAVVEETAAALGITDADAKARLGATTRQAKRETVSREALRDNWLSRLTPEERTTLEAIHARSSKPAKPLTVDRGEEAVEWALSHVLTRQSVTTEQNLITAALRHGVGETTLEGVRQALERRQDLIRAEIDGTRMISTEAVLAEEQAVLGFARAHRGRLPMLAPGGEIRDDRLSAEQRQAVFHVWGSRDAITLVRGKAGTGKTTMMRETVAGLEASGKAVAVLAPTAAAAYDVLRDKEGFASASTVASFLEREQEQDRFRHGVIWIDEAGLLGFRDMSRVVEAARRLNARLVLSGDRKQLRAVNRGEPLALLEDRAGLKAAQLSTIRRQTGAYRRSVELLAEGNVTAGLSGLQAMGAIHAMPEAAPYAALAEEYCRGAKAGQDILLLSPSRAEGEAITRVVREKLRETGQIGKDEHSLLRLLPLHLTEAERSDTVGITGTTAVFVRSADGFRAGQRVEVTPELAPRLARIPNAFAAYERSEMKVAVGDKLRIVANGRDRSRQHRVTNGSVYRVAGFDGDSGNVILSNGWRMAADHGTWMPGYALTSYAGQGKTVDKVILAVSSLSHPAANTRQMYVDASRGRKGISIYTEDAQALLMAAARDDRRLHASDLMRAAKPKPSWRRRLARQLSRNRRNDDLRRPLFKEKPHDGRPPQMAR